MTYEQEAHISATNPSERAKQLEGMDFVFVGHWRRQSAPWLKLYHKKHGHMGVPRSFVVPREDP
jgi:hypothetical protein